MYKALLLCNSVFPDDPAMLPRLHGPRRDGLLLWGALVDQSSGVFRSENVEVLFEGSRQDMAVAAERFFAEGAPDDVLLFYYSGHGRRPSSELLLCCRDTVTSRPMATGLMSDVLNKMIERSSARAVIVILDCCYSGAFKGGTAIEKDLAGKGRFVLAAASAYEEAKDADKAGAASPFTEALVAGLMRESGDADSDGKVTLEDLYGYLEETIKPPHPAAGRKFDGTGSIAIARRPGRLAAETDIAGALRYETPQPVSVPLVWGSVPYRSRNFTGRAELLRDVHERFTGSSEPVNSLALHGFPGIGKTQVATEYVYRYRSDYDVVWWIPADQLVLVRAGLAGLAGPLGLEAWATSGIDAVVSQVLDALRRGDPFARWLLIFDNADEPRSMIDLIPDGPGQTLVTTRDPSWRGVVDAVAVNSFSRSESLEFLTRRAFETVGGQDADLLAEKLGDLPLALAQAAALITDKGMSAAQYVRLLSERPSELLSEGGPSEYPVPMTGAYNIAKSRLKQVRPDALELLNCLAFFGPEPIPLDVIRQGASTGVGRSSAGLRPELDKILGDPIMLSRAIEAIVLSGLAWIELGSNTIQVHRLIQALIRDDLEADDSASFRHEVHLLLSNAAPSDLDDESEWPRFASLAAHLNSSHISECNDGQVRKFALDMVHYLHLSGSDESSRAFAKELIEQWTADSGQDDPNVLLARQHLTDTSG